MANYFAQACVGFTVTNAQAPIVIEAISMVEEIPWKLMNIIAAEKVLTDEELSALSPAERIALNTILHGSSDLYSIKETVAAENSCSDDMVYVSLAEFQCELEESHGGDCSLVVISGDETIDEDIAANFIHSVLHEFDMPDVIEMGVAYTCSKSRIGAYGGATLVITKEGVQRSDGQLLLDAERQAATNDVDYYLGTITDVNGESEYDSKVIKVVTKGDDPRAAFRELLVNDWNGSAESVDEENDLVRFEDGKATRLNVDVQKLKPIEYATLSKYLPVY